MLFISAAGLALSFYVIGILTNQPEIPLIVDEIFPRLKGESAYTLMSLLGASIMPHNFYLHSSIVQVPLSLTLLSLYIYMYVCVCVCVCIPFIFILLTLTLLSVSGYLKRLIPWLSSVRFGWVFANCSTMAPLTLLNYPTGR